MAGRLAGAAAAGSGAAAATIDRARVESTSAADTVDLGARLGSVARAGDLVCLWGELGAGKTQLAKGIARGLGVVDTVNSLFHVDLYRLADASDALAGGVVDDRQEDGLTVVEWPDRLGSILPTARLDVEIDGTGDEPRAIDVVARDPRYRRYVEAAR